MKKFIGVIRKRGEDRRQVEIPLSYHDVFKVGGKVVVRLVDE